MKKLIAIPLFILACMYSTGLASQNPTGYADSLPQLDKRLENYLNKTSKTTEEIDAQLTKSTQKVLASMAEQENKIQQKISRLDSAFSSRIFAGTAEKYKTLLTRIQQPLSSGMSQKIGEYIPGFDTLRSAFKFLDRYADKFSALSPQKITQLKVINDKIDFLKERLKQVDEVKSLLKERANFLNEQLHQFGLAKNLKKINKQLTGYIQTVNEYKTLLNDPEKIAGKIIEVIKQTDIFKNFMQENSLLSGLFASAAPMPASAVGLAGLQPRAAINQVISQRVAIGGNNAAQALQQQVTQAKESLNALKNKVNSLGGGDGDWQLPQAKQNSGKKKIWNKLEYGANIQFGKINNLLPAASDIAISVGYKINSRFTAGLGGGYKLGLGNSWSTIKLTNEGASLRSFADIKLKYNFYIATAYEQNYYTSFSAINALKDKNAWQPSFLAGFSKRYAAGKKLKGNFQLLYDFLYNNNNPATPAFKFRIGYTL